jgi:succinyl-diaminopimelate desuccinylase
MSCPPGEGWSSAPFAADLREVPGGKVLYGRGAVDMKGAIAAMVCGGASRSRADWHDAASSSPATRKAGAYGTVPLIAHMREVGASGPLPRGRADLGARLGDMVKIGRRGSVNMWLTAKGAQGHVAYPHLADNPIPRLVALLAELDAAGARRRQ